MKSFMLQLQSSVISESIENVISFVGEDDSGSFGILAGHCRMMTCLKYGLAWFRYTSGAIEYLALPGGVVYFVNNKLIISTRHYLRSKNYQEITTALDHELYLEEKNIQEVKTVLHDLDKGIMQQLREMKRVTRR